MADKMKIETSLSFLRTESYSCTAGQSSYRSHLLYLWVPSVAEFAVRILEAQIDSWDRLIALQSCRYYKTQLCTSIKAGIDSNEEEVCPKAFGLR